MSKKTKGKSKGGINILWIYEEDAGPAQEEKIQVLEHKCKALQAKYGWTQFL